MSRFRRSISLLLAIALVLAMSPVQASATETEETVVDQISGTAENAITGSDEEGLFTFTTFADLQKLAKGTYTDYTCFQYAGTGTFTISQNLTIPENVMLDFLEGHLVIPAGVTLTAGTHTNVHYMTVKGTLKCFSVFVYNEAIIEGSVICSEAITICGECVFSGVDNITFTGPIGQVTRMHTPVSTTAELKSVLSVVSKEPAILHNISFGGEDFVLSESITFPSNTEVHFAITNIPKGITVTSNGFMTLYNQMTVKGKFVNNGKTHFDQIGDLSTMTVASGASLVNNGTMEFNCNSTCKLTIASGGSYSGNGILYCYAGSKNVDFSKNISGINLSSYYVEETYYADYGMYSWSYSPNALPCSLSELTTADYLAMSAIAYLDFDPYAYWVGSDFDSVGSYKTIQECLTDMGIWNSDWSETHNITYAQLCAHIAGWEVLTYENDSDSNGFYAVAFRNKENEAVISYRGSVPLDELEESNGWDAIQDWILYDLPAQILNKVLEGEQYVQAFRMYDRVAAGGRSKSQIVVTGHSLGGGLANLVSARYGCNGNTINAISVLDALFYNAPITMGENYVGIDTWTFTDHANQRDVLAGMYEHYVSTKIKPYIAYKGNVDLSDNTLSSIIGSAVGPAGSLAVTVAKIISCHFLDSLVQKDSSGKVTMTSQTSSFRVLGWKKSEMDLGLKHVNFGSSKADTISYGFLDLNQRAAFGGAGADYITTTDNSDILIGGNGNDTLDGGWANDTYIYYKGNGVDTIHDTDGNDRLYLYNFSKGETITVETKSDSDYVLVKAGGNTIVKINKSGRKALSTDTFKVVVEHTDGTRTEHDVTPGFKSKTFKAKMKIACPVTVEILDEQGNVVYTLEDGVVGSYYTDYGNFYVYEEEDGSYGKVLELVEGYSARAVGNDTGTMDVAYQPITDGALGEIQALEDVPITAEFVATVEEDNVGDAILVMDTDGDGAADETVKIGACMHEEVVLEGKEATCTEAGLTEGKQCSKCGEILTVQEEIPATGHTYDNALDADCNSCGEIRAVEQEKPTEPSVKPEKVETTPMYRLYNPNSGEHFYTGSLEEKENLVAAGWQYEGVAWNAPTKTGAPVYRMYNPNSGDHHYTTSAEEKDMLVSVGWQYEGVCWNSMGEIALYRLYNPNADCGSHHYTGSEEERDFLVSVGWIYEGIGWFGMLN